MNVYFELLWVKCLCSRLQILTTYINEYAWSSYNYGACSPSTTSHSARFSKCQHLSISPVKPITTDNTARLTDSVCGKGLNCSAKDETACCLGLSTICKDRISARHSFINDYYSYYHAYRHYLIGHAIICWNALCWRMSMHWMNSLLNALASIILMLSKTCSQPIIIVDLTV